MPELPEVETTRRGLEPYVAGNTIVRVVCRAERLRWPIPQDLSESLSGQPVLSLNRRGKYLLARMPAGTLMVHLGMSGSLRWLERPEPLRKHDHIDVLFENGGLLRYHDPRRFGAWLWTNQPPDRHPLLAGLGPEPLSSDFTADRLQHCAKGRKIAIKSLIMDSRCVVGVGNIYANEALFLAGIRPDRPAGRIAGKRHAELVRAIQAVLGRAIEQGGTTLRDFVNGAGQPGYFQQQLNVYNRAGQPCRRCGNRLTGQRIGNRSTVFCRQCQR